MSSSFKQVIAAEIAVERAKLPVIDTLPTEQIGTEDNEEAVGAMIAMSVTLLCAFVLAIIVYFVTKCDEREGIV